MGKKKQKQNKQKNNTNPPPEPINPPSNNAGLKDILSNAASGGDGSDMNPQMMLEQLMKTLMGKGLGEKDEPEINFES